MQVHIYTAAAAVRSSIINHPPNSVIVIVHDIKCITATTTNAASKMLLQQIHCCTKHVTSTIIITDNSANKSKHSTSCNPTHSYRISYSILLLPLHICFTITSTPHLNVYPSLSLLYLPPHSPPPISS